MKTVNLDNPVYGALWSKALESDKDENDILRRLLNMPRTVPAAGRIVGAAAVQAAAAVPELFPVPLTTADTYHQSNWVSGQGFTDPRYGVTFPEGFSIFRSYKGKNYDARVFMGKWAMPDRDEKFDSLNALNKAVGAGTENAWYSWYYRDLATGLRRRIGDLRDPSTIQKREKNKGG